MSIYFPFLDVTIDLAVPRALQGSKEQSVLEWHQET